MGGRGGAWARASARDTPPTLSELKTSVDTIGQSMAALASYATPYGRAAAERNGETATQIERKASSYYAAQREYNEIRQEYNRLRDMQMQERTAGTSGNHTFVNSYGEATTREITSATYERAQKALEKRIRQWMKSYR